MNVILNWSKLPLFLAIILYLLIYLIRFQQGGWEPKIELFSQTRQIIDQKITELLPSPQAQLLSGILLGEKKDIPASLRLALRDTSTIHIVVVSGQNLSLLAGFILALSGLIKRKLAIILAFLAIVFYVVLTGAQVPVLRAALMVTFTFLAQIFGRESDSIWVLVLVAGLMLLINPLWILNLSFQLSFLATLGVVTVTPIFLKYLKSLPLIGQDLAVTIGAQLLVMPVIVQNFHQVSLVGILANLLVLWTIPYIMITGTVMIIVASIWNFAGVVLSFIVSSLLTYFVYVVEFFSSLPFAWEYVGQQLWIVWIGYYLILAGACLFIKNFKTT